MKRVIGIVLFVPLFLLGTIEMIIDGDAQDNFCWDLLYYLLYES